MKALILAGGKGTRLSPVTLEIPKPLLTVRKKPIINYLVDLFLRHGVSDLAVSINRSHAADFLDWKQHYYPDQNIHFVIEAEALGTFGGIYNAREWLGPEPFFYTNGDELKDLDLTYMKKFHEFHGALATVALVEVEDPQHYGVAVTNGPKIERFVEKPQDPPSKFVNAGLSLLDPAVFTLYPHPEPKFAMVELDLFPQLAQGGKLHGFKFTGKWMDTGTFERWERAIREWEG
ncbi:MAG: nucleotidyltransferase family protein [Parcubacteria group bacterium]|nr:nucleotidyltransferase family protein [Parcubacteria group bacterium]